MPKLLDFVAQSGYSHEEVIKILEANPKSQEQIEEKEDLEEDAEEELEESNTEKSKEPKEDGVLSITQDQLNKLINAAIDERLKATRTAPPKGKPKEMDKVQDKGVIQKNMFEVIV